MATAPFETHNRLLRSFSPEDMALIAPHLSLVPLDVRQPLEAPNKPIEYCHFVESGIVSVVARSPHHRRVEAGLVGPEGMTGLPVVMSDDRSPNETFVQVAGSSRRLAADDLRGALTASATLQRRLLRYAQAFLVQTTHTALSNGTAKVAERLARWILMSHDRMGDDLPLTHEFLSVMLAVRRPGVTDAVHELEGHGLIRSVRGRISIIDREGLVEAANGSYGVPESEYERLLG